MMNREEFKKVLETVGVIGQLGNEEVLFFKAHKNSTSAFNVSQLYDMYQENFVRNHTVIDFIDSSKKLYLDVNDAVEVPNDFADIIGYYRVICDETLEGIHSYVLQKNMAVSITKEQAIANMLRRGIVFETMSQTITRLESKIPYSAEESYSLDAFRNVVANIEEEYMYKFSNSTASSGMLLLASPEILDIIFERFGSFFILPSSNKELLIFPSEDLSDIRHLKKIVKEINSDSGVITPEDFFTDTIFFYNGTELMEF